jgi:hypothetical protein
MGCERPLFYISLDNVCLMHTLNIPSHSCIDLNNL